MKKVLLGILAVVALIVGAVCVIAATKPDVFKFERSTVVNAPPEKVFFLVENFHHWKDWSPFEALDSNLKRTYSGPESGKGAVYEWDGNNEAGQGRMEIVEVEPPNKVRIKLDFIKPFQASNIAEFKMAPVESGTKVTWSMEGPNPFMCKVMQVFCNMDDMLGKDFDKGLANIKASAENPVP